jgi:hypothetical protein
LGQPFAVVAAARIVFAPATSGTVMDRVCQVVQAPVAGKGSSSATSVPLTLMSIGRVTAVPLAKPKRTVAGPAWAALTVHETELPTTLSVLTYPRPLNPTCVASKTPCETVASSASNRFGGGSVGSGVEPFVARTRSAPPVVLALSRTA